MQVSNVTPNFAGKNIVILAKDGINAKRPLLFNEIMNIAKDFHSTVSYHTGKDARVNVSSISEDFEKALKKANIKFRLDEGNKLKLIG